MLLHLFHVLWLWPFYFRICTISPFWILYLKIFLRVSSSVHPRYFATNSFGVIPSVMMCYYPGQEGSYAMVDAIFGKFNPSGKLTLSIPRGAGFVPAYYSYKPQSRRGYTLGHDISALYPFGFGLSYTTYKYSNLRLSSATMGENDTVQAIVDVTNTGKVAGDEIVQLYIHDDIASVTRPVKELKGLARVHIEPGQTVSVSIPIDRKSLEFYNSNLELVTEKGTFTVMVGPSSLDTSSVTLTLE